MMEFWDSTLFTWVVLPFLIFLARVADVSIGTLRIVYIVRKEKIIAPLLGFVEVVIWLAAVGQIFKHLDNIVCFFAFAGGFAMGNYVGMLIEGKLAIGQLMVRIIADNGQADLYKKLKTAGFNYTLVDGQGAAGPVTILFSVIQRKELTNMLGIVTKHAPKAFYTVENVQIAREAMLPQPTLHPKSYYRALLKMDRKRK